MTFEQRYKRAKKRLLQDPAICEPNRALFAEFLEYQEYKLKRINGLAQLDEAAYKTVTYYVSRLSTVNRWFNNKPWVDLTKEDIKQVYDGVEDGRIRTPAGKAYRGTEAFFRRIMRGKPFALAGKHDLAVAVMEFYRPRSNSEVRFIREESFRELVGVVGKLEHKTFLWMAWDIGENAHSLLQLRKRDFRRQTNPETGEAEYIVNLRREILKRSRTPRAEVTNYRETVGFLDLVLRNLADGELVFRFGARMVRKILDRAVRITGVTCIPGAQTLTPKVLRSSMACDLLSKGWTTDEVNYRLGHKPSSREIDKYVSWLALDQNRPKKRVFESNVAELQRNLDEAGRREKLSSERLRRQDATNESIRNELDRLREDLHDLKRMLTSALGIVRPAVRESVQIL